ncbi:hypothetical protein LAZ67_2003404 [Cordylochernes scorpioides]|uniref:Uncharacterized protein n=1 Tax=Cordylochernes scorpioides TaxID=51811 RepID=A0ABY6K4G0_9ARAC|nr:hypothetical protein LAZ67_2003404 [Cordylochernes scorpioides]
MDENYEKGVQLYKEIDMKKAVYMVEDAWATLKDTRLIKSWNKLLLSEESITAFKELQNSQFVSGLAEPISKSLYLKNVARNIFNIGWNVVDDHGSSDNEDEFRDDEQVEKGPSNEEDFHCLETAMKWLEQQEECNTFQFVF